MRFLQAFRRRPLVARAGLIVLAFVGFSILWISITDQILGWLVQDPAQLIRLATYKGGVYIAIVALFLFWQVVSALEATREEGGQTPEGFTTELQSLWGPLALFAAAALLLVCLGVVIYQRQRAQSEQVALRNLSEETRRQVDQLENWFQERRSDAAATAKDSLLQETVRRLGAAPGLAAQLRPVLDQRLKTLQEAYPYDSVKLLDPAGKVLAASDGRAVDAVDRQAVALVTLANPVVLAWAVPPGQEAGTQARISCGALLLDAKGASVLGELVFQLSLDKLLAQILKGLPNDTSTLETLLVCEQGGDLVYLSPTRLSNQAIIRMPMARTELVGVLAMRAGEGTFRGVDYRGVASVAVSHPLSSLPWVLLAKIDQTELSLPLRRLSLIYGGVGLLFLALASIALFVWRKRETARVQAERRRIQAENRLLEYRIEFLSQHANDILLLLEQTGRIRYANERALAAYGYSQQALQDLSIQELFAPNTLGDLPGQVPALLERWALRFEAVHCRKDGAHFPVEVSCQSLVLEEVPCFQSIIRDLTERKQAEVALRESGERYHRLFDEAVEGLALADLERDAVIDCNQAFLRLTGRERSEVIGTSLAKFHSPQQLKTLREHIQPILRGETLAGTLATRLLSASGAEKDVEIKVSRIELSGKWLALGFFRDLTEERQRALERETTVNLLRLLNEHDTTHGLISNLTRFLQNWSGCEAVGIRLREGEDFPYFETRGFPAEFIERNSQLCVRDLEGRLLRDAVGKPLLACVCGSVLCGRLDPALPCFTANGSFWSNGTTDLLTSATEQDRPAQTPNHCLGVGYESVALIPIRSGQEILGLLQLNDHAKGAFTSERIAFLEEMGGQIALALAKRQAQAALVYSEKRFRDLSEAAGEFLWETGADGTFSFVSNRITDILGYTPEELIGRDPFAFVVSSAAERIKALKDEARSFRNREVPLISKSGLIIWASITRVIKLDSQGRAVGYFGAGLEITERKLAEQELRESEGRYRSLYSAMQQGAFYQMRDGTLLDPNPAALRMFGLTEAEFTGRTSLDPAWHVIDEEGAILPGQDHPTMVALRTGKPVLEAVVGVYNPRCQAFNWLLVDALPEFLEGAEGVPFRVSATMHDITERKLAEDALRANEAKLELALRSARMGVWTWDIQEGRRYFDARVCQLLGIDQDSFAGTQEEFLQVVVPEDREGVQAAWARTIETNRPYEADFRVRWKDGSLHSINSRGQLVKGESGKSLKLYGILWDITQRKALETLARQNQERFRQALLGAPYPILIHAEDGEVLSLNEAWTDASGYSLEDIPTMEAWAEQAHPGQKRHVMTHNQSLYGISTRVLEGSSTVVIKSGETRIWDFASAPLEPMPDGRRVIISMARDVTVLREVEAALRQKSEELERYFSESLDLLCIADSEGYFRRLNPEWEKVLGYPLEELNGRRFLDLVHPEDLPTALRAVATLADQQEVVTFTNRYQCKDGSYRWIEWRTHLMGGMIYATARDITERKRLGDELRESEARFRNAIAGAPFPILIHAEDGAILALNETWTHFSGYDLADIPTLGVWLEKAYGSSSARIQSTIEGLFNSEGPVEEGDFVLRTKGGALRTWEFASAPLGRLADGRRTLITMARDVTEQRMAESALKASEEKYRRLFDTMKEGFALHEIITDAAGNPFDYRYLDVNPAFEALTGLSRENWLGHTVLEVIPQTEPYWIETYGRVALTGEALRIENYSAPLGRWYQVFAFSPAPRQFAVLVSDSTERKQAELALQKSERFLREAQLVGRIGCYSLDLVLGIWESSGTFDEIFGVGADYPRDVQGWLDLAVPDFREELRRYVRDTIQHGIRFDIDYRMIRPGDGQERWISALGVLERDDNGQAVRLIGTMQDISEWKQSEMEIAAKNELLSLTGRMAKMGGWEFDPKTLKGTWTDEVARIHDLDPKDPTSVGIGVSLYTPDSREQIEGAIAEAIGSGKPYDLELELISAKGIHKDVRTVCSPVVNDRGEVVQIRGIFQDITERKAAEAEIRRMTEVLEQRVQERTAQLEAANQELEAFSYSVSHDLRGPLRGIDGFSQALMEDYQDRLDEEGRHFLARIRAGTQRMGQLIDDLLKLSRVNRSQLDRMEVDLSSLCRRILEELASAYPERQVEISIHPGLLAQADRRLLEVALENLLGNAWKFTSKVEAARIEVGEIFSSDGERVFCIRDNGAGFDMTYIDKLFDAFQRLHSANEYEGTGIGLTIVQRIIHRHGGRIWAEAETGKGASFFFTLPEEGIPDYPLPEAASETVLP